MLGYSKNKEHQMAKTATERNNDYRERMKAKGFKEAKVWVPAVFVAKLRAYAKKLCASK